MAANGSAAKNTEMAGVEPELEPLVTIPLTEAEIAKLMAIEASAGVHPGPGGVAAAAAALEPNVPSEENEPEGVQAYLQVPRNIHDDTEPEGPGNIIPRGLGSLGAHLTKLGKKSMRLAGYGYLLNPPTFTSHSELAAIFEAYAAGAPPTTKLQPARSCLEGTPLAMPRDPKTLGYFSNLYTWTKIFPQYAARKSAGIPVPFVMFWQFRTNPAVSMYYARQHAINIYITTKEAMEHYHAAKGAPKTFFGKAAAAVKGIVAPVTYQISYDLGLNELETNIFRSAARLTPPVPVLGQIAINVQSLGEGGEITYNGHTISFILLGKQLILLDPWPTFEFTGFIGDTTSPWHLFKVMKDAFEVLMGELPLQVIYRPCIVRILEGRRKAIGVYTPKFVAASELDKQFSSNLQQLDNEIIKSGKCVAWSTILLESAVNLVNLQVSAGGAASGGAAAGPAGAVSRNSPQDIAIAIRQFVYDPLQAEVEAAVALPPARRSNAFAALMGKFYGGGRRRRHTRRTRRARRTRKRRCV